MHKKLESIKELSDMVILYVEDDQLIAEAFIMTLKRIVNNVYYRKNGAEGLEAYRSINPDIIISDVKMPVMGGMEMSKIIRKENDDIPIIIVSAYNETEFLEEAFSSGITYYLKKPVNRLVLMRSLNECAKSVVYKRHQEELAQNHEESIDAFVNLIEKRDRYTAGHSTRVAKYCVMIADALGVEKHECALLEKAAKLHDIGKIEIPDSILLNPSKLSELEYSIIQEHLNSGYAVLSKIKQYEELAEIMRYHHERYDGSGYPQGVSGDDIPYLSRIMMIADAFDAMTTNRIYKPRKSVDDAIAEIESLGGKFFHPEIIPVAIDVLRGIDIDEHEDQMPQNQLEDKKFSYFFSDLLSGLYNENYLNSIISKKDDLQNGFSSISHVAKLDLHNFSHYNKIHGWQNGNKIIEDIAGYLFEKFSESLLFRIRGDQFYILAKNTIFVEEKELNQIIDNDEIYFDVKQCTFEEFLNKVHYFEK